MTGHKEEPQLWHAEKGDPLPRGRQGEGGRARVGLSADSDLRRTLSCWVQSQIEFSKGAEFPVGYTVGTQDRDRTEKGRC